MKKRPHALDRAAAVMIPLVFVFLWSTGWIVARLAADDADPLTFLTLRFAGAALCLFIYAVASGAQWPRTRWEWLHTFVSGVFLHAIYLGGVWWAIAHGLPATISALLASLQPILTAIFAPWLVREHLTARNWFGVMAGFAGLVLVLAPGLATAGAIQSGMTAILVAVNAIGMLSLTLGTFYQKRFIRTGDLRSVSCLQFVSAATVTLLLASAFEEMRIVWTANTVIALVWSVVAVSVVSIALLLHLLRRGDVSKSAQLIYLVPPTAALQAYLLFGERLSLVQIIGGLVTVAGVIMATRR